MTEDTLSDDYIIETVGASSVSMEGFIPKRKVALLFEGAGTRYGASFNMVIDFLVQRGYSYITAVRDSSGHPFCSDSVGRYRSSVYGKIADLARELTPDDVLFTAVIGASIAKDGVVSLPLHHSDALLAYELRDLLSTIPIHHAVHYASPDVHAGTLARVLSGTEHVDLGNRHIAIAPTIPGHFDSFSLHKPDSSHPSFELITPFHAKFFDLADQPTLEARFQQAAAYQRRYRLEQAYMTYAAVQPREVAFTH